MIFPDHLLKQIRQGNVCLLLGAGCSLTSEHSTGHKIPSTSDFCNLVCQEAGLQYSGENPKDVFQAVRAPSGPLSKRDIKDLFIKYFTDCIPAPEINSLMGFSWRRIYTFNVDDVLRNTRRKSRAQKLRHINARREGRADWRNLTECQVVHLHGYAGEYENGIIFSREEYANELHNKSGWYESVGEDFSNYTLLVIGSSLDEPILDYHIKTFVQNYSDGGHSYIITPDKPTEIRIRSLENSGFKHLQGSLEAFVGELRSKFPDGMPPESIKGDITTNSGSRLSPEDLEGLRSFYAADRGSITNAEAFAATSKAALGRKFFDGYGPDAFTIASGIPATLSQDAEIEKSVWRSFAEGALGVCILGEAGSGKSTFTYKVLAGIADVNSHPVFLYRENSTTLAISLLALERFFEQSNIEFGVVLVDELHVYAEQIGELHTNNRLRRVRILTSSRRSEWHASLRRRVGSEFESFEYRRFEKQDIDGIIDQLTKHYPSPSFTKLSYEEKRSSFARSKQQLLIALREATSSEVFDDTIRHEFERINSEAARLLLTIICWATIARVGINRGVCQSIYSKLGLSESFHDSKNELEGIIGVNAKDRYMARHEMYARVIVETLLNPKRLEQILGAYFEYFSEFEMPVIQKVDRLDAQLFKYCLSSRNIYTLFTRMKDIEAGSRLFERFSVQFQLDGHFWLQWALFLRRVDRQKEALSAMETSVEAYTENLFARHALAQQKLIVAGLSENFGSIENKLITQAVDELREQHELTNSSPWRTSSEEYPIVTLANHHVDALYKLGQAETARRLAGKYFNEIENFAKIHPSGDYLTVTRSRLLAFSTQGIWNPPFRKTGQIDYG